MDYMYNENGVRINLQPNGLKEDRFIGILKNNSEKLRTINKIADNTEATVQILKEQNHIIKQNNEAVIEKLVNIHKELNDLFNLCELAIDENADYMKEAIEIAEKLQSTIEQNGKFDIKEFVGDFSIAGFFMGLQMLIQNS